MREWMKYFIGVFFIRLSVLCLSSFLLATPGVADVQTLSVVTPYPEPLTKTFKVAFELANPDIKLNIINASGTGAALSYVLDDENTGAADVFWASSETAFLQLQEKGALQRYKPKVRGLPKQVAGVSLAGNGYYFSGFSLTSYGFMLNEHYLDAWKLPEPVRWQDLTRTDYFDHLIMSTPTLSGSMHMMVESLLQVGIWQERWYLLKRIVANATRLTPSSYEVVDAVRGGDAGLGLVIDYYALSLQAQRDPIRFVYPERPALTAAFVGLLDKATNSEAGQRFINYLLSYEGQFLLLDKNVSRLPIRSEVYQQAAEWFPNPFAPDNVLQGGRTLDLHAAQLRYHLVNVLFDKLITFNFNELKLAVSKVQCLEGLLLSRQNDEAEALLAQAEEQLSWLPFDDILLDDESYLKAFADADGYLPEWDVDVRIEEGIAYQPDQWSRKAWVNYRQAVDIANQGIKVLGGECQ